MRGALITVRCDCGEVRYLEYGEVWECDCGRRWNTAQIPAGEYWGILHEARRQRLLMMGVAAVVAAVFLALAYLTEFRVMALAPVLLAGWFLILMPRWRRKLREQARSLPTWKLNAE